MVECDGVRGVECDGVRGVECDGVRGVECDSVRGVECDGVRPRLLCILAGLVSLEGESPTPMDRREEMSLTESFGPAWVLADLLQINMTRQPTLQHYHTPTGNMYR